METVTLRKEQAFVHDVKLLGLSNSDIISCQVRTSNLFTKFISKKEVIVFSDYDVLICYKEKKHSFKTKVIRKAFCEIVPYEELEENDQVNSHKVKATAVYLSQPACRCKFINLEGNVLLKIEVSGKIQVTVFLSEAKSYDQMMENQEIENLLRGVNYNNYENEPLSIIEMNKENINEKEQILQFDENDNISLEELMEMDCDTLKLMSK